MTARAGTCGGSPPGCPTLAAIVAMMFLVGNHFMPVGAASERSTAQPWVRWGFTHTQVSGDHGQDSAIAALQHALRQQPLIQNQHIMGWGAENPEPHPDAYDFTSLDTRVEFIRRSGGVPVITLCCAPDWMKGGEPGSTDWARIEEAPLPEYYHEFAELSAVVAQRYPDVRHFIVWNELKGFFDDETNSWDAAAYTALYDLVYEALKSVDPEIQVGGPYVSMTTDRSDDAGDGDGDGSSISGPWGRVDQRALDAFNYWFERNEARADFIVIDGRATTEGGASDEFAALDKFGAITRSLRERTSLPIWWAEWYVTPADPRWTSQRTLALRAAALIEMVANGVETALYWSPPPGDATCTECLWTDTREPDGGVRLPMLDILQEFAKWFPAGTDLQQLDAPPQIRLFAQERRLVAVNTIDEEMVLEVDGLRLHLEPYETRWLERR